MKKTQDTRHKTGSAIILAVVLVSLLAIVAVIFLTSARVDNLSTSSISDNENLNLAVDTVISQISEQLALNSPRADANSVYYTYPDNLNPWLASLEPNDFNLWPHITDLYNQFGIDACNLKVSVVYEHQNPAASGAQVDADGDGVVDSRWVPVQNFTTSKGKTVFAAVRIIDNSAMLNANTGFIFDPNNALFNDGSSQTQINLVSLAYRPSYIPTSTEIQVYANSLNSYRCGQASPGDIASYTNNVIWQYGLLNGAYTPFDISDELEMRYRFLINQNDTFTRIEESNDQFDIKLSGVPFPNHPFDKSSNYNADDWCTYARNSNPLNSSYAYRHIVTTQNIDRVINPAGLKMYNINDSNSSTPAGINAVYQAVRASMDPNLNPLAAQIAANLVDYIDGPQYGPGDPRYDPNNAVTVVYDSNNNPHFGFEQPCIYISELAENIFDPNPADPCHIIEKSFAIELFKPYVEDTAPGPVNTDWHLVITSTATGIPVDLPVIWSGNPNFHVFYNDDYNVIDVNFEKFKADNPSPLDGDVGILPSVILKWPAIAGASSYNVFFGTDYYVVFNATTADANVFKGNFPASVTTFDPPGLLDMNTIYYWRIDTITAATSLKGAIWRFTVNAMPSSDSRVVFNTGDWLQLYRKVFDPCKNTYPDLLVDQIQVPLADANGWFRVEPNDSNHSRFATHTFQRDISSNKPIRRLWDYKFQYVNESNLGGGNNFISSDGLTIQAHPANALFTNIGQIGQLFYRPVYDYGNGGADLPPPGVAEPYLRINIADANFQQVFKYLTVMDPAVHTGDLNENRIKGRININTAPWFVLAQLPWLSWLPDGSLNYKLAQAIVAYRDKTISPSGVDFRFRDGSPGFQNIGQLNNVIAPLTDPCSSMDYYFKTGNAFPALTPPDGTNDEFEKRDAIFTRISNLVTVRSDLFTAYILVRIGTDGPQKRYIAILDRSEYPNKPVKVIALQQVPDPR